MKIWGSGNNDPNYKGSGGGSSLKRFLISFITVGLVVVAIMVGLMLASGFLE